MTEPHPIDSLLAVVPCGDHRFSARIDRGFFGYPGPHGGHLAAVVLRALAMEVDDAELAPRTLTIHFTSVADDTPVQIETRLDRRGRSLSTVSGRMLQGKRLIALAVAGFGRSRPGPDLHQLEMPEVPSPENGRVPSERASERTAAAMRHYEYRFSIGRPFSGEPARAGGWVRPRRPRLADAEMVAIYSDIWLPAVFVRLQKQAPVPTVELTINFMAALPVEGARPDDWYFVLFDAPSMSEGYFREEGTVWTRDGRPLARCSQLGVFLEDPGS